MERGGHRRRTPSDAARGSSQPCAGLAVPLERAKGFEPSTCSLGSCHSTTELRPLGGVRDCVGSAPSGEEVRRRLKTREGTSSIGRCDRARCCGLAFLPVRTGIEPTISEEDGCASYGAADVSGWHRKECVPRPPRCCWLSGSMAVCRGAGRPRTESRWDVGTGQERAMVSRKNSLAVAVLALLGLGAAGCMNCPKPAARVVEPV